MARLSRDAEVERDTQERVSRILADVRLEGLDAVLRYTEIFDGLSLDSSRLRVPAEDLAKSLADLRASDPDLILALESLIANVRRFAQGQRNCVSDLNLNLPGGGTVGERWVALSRVGLYIPGGRAFYPSTLAMTVIPAQVAGVRRIVAVTPPKGEGPDPLVLATAALLGLEEIYTLGGAQAIAWLAFGEPAVDLIAGPGNRFVAEAKRQLQGRCGIDSVAGPTELLIIADGCADAAILAEDMLAQAEHDPDAAAVLISEDQALLDQVALELEGRVAASPRRTILEQSLPAHGLLICASRKQAIAFAQEWAPEHLELAVGDPEAWAPFLTTAGALFLGPSSGEAFGDYGAGPNHVLPTSRTARYSSPLGVATFLKRQSLIQLNPADAASMAPWVQRLAQAEGLYHHAMSAEHRVERRHRGR
ncbi:MAG: histidinol dehydrogenase [Holophagaceae bacterium]|nr:histidinol dehydrogenase [Holophagaceae bacterium]